MVRKGSRRPVYLHRNHHGALDAEADAMKELVGFCSASLLVYRASGRAVSTATYDSRQAMQRNREQADAVRSAGSLETGAQVLQVCEFDLALAHLRVPEMA